MTIFLMLLCSEIRKLINMYVHRKYENTQNVLVWRVETIKCSNYVNSCAMSVAEITPRFRSPGFIQINCIRNKGIAHLGYILSTYSITYVQDLLVKCFFFKITFEGMLHTTRIEYILLHYLNLDLGFWEFQKFLRYVFYQLMYFSWSTYKTQHHYHLS